MTVCLTLKNMIFYSELLIWRMFIGYELLKTLVRYRVAQTRQSRRAHWPAYANWIMNSAKLIKQGSTMWQGVMKVKNTIQLGLEQENSTS